MENEKPNIDETNSANDTPQDFFRKGVEDATAKAKEYAPKFKKEVDTILGEVAYGAGFVPGFLGTFIKEFIPEGFSEELQRGVAKGQESARECATKVKESTKPKSETVSDAEVVPV